MSDAIFVEDSSMYLQARNTTSQNFGMFFSPFFRKQKMLLYIIYAFEQVLGLTELFPNSKFDGNFRILWVGTRNRINLFLTFTKPPLR